MPERLQSKNIEVGSYGFSENPHPYDFVCDELKQAGISVDTLIHFQADGSGIVSLVTDNLTASRTFEGIKADPRIQAIVWASSGDITMVPSFSKTGWSPEVVQGLKALNLSRGLENLEKAANFENDFAHADFKRTLAGLAREKIDLPKGESIPGDELVENLTRQAVRALLRDDIASKKLALLGGSAGKKRPDGIRGTIFKLTQRLHR